MSRPQLPAGAWAARNGEIAGAWAARGPPAGPYDSSAEDSAAGMRGVGKSGPAYSNDTTRCDSDSCCQTLYHFVRGKGDGGRRTFRCLVGADKVRNVLVSLT